MKNITLVGAGSASFGFSTLVDIFYYADLLQGSTITLNDVNAESLEHMLRLAERLVRETGAQLSFKASTDLRTAVAGTESRHQAAGGRVMPRYRQRLSRRWAGAGVYHWQGR